MNLFSLHEAGNMSLQLASKSFVSQTLNAQQQIVQFVNSNSTGCFIDNSGQAYCNSLRNTTYSGGYSSDSDVSAFDSTMNATYVGGVGASTNLVVYGSYTNDSGHYGLVSQWNGSLQEVLLSDITFSAVYFDQSMQMTYAVGS